MRVEFVDLVDQTVISGYLVAAVGSSLDFKRYRDFCNNLYLSIVRVGLEEPG